MTIITRDNKRDYLDMGLTRPGVVSTPSDLGLLLLTRLVLRNMRLCPLVDVVPVERASAGVEVMAILE